MDKQQGIMLPRKYFSSEQLDTRGNLSEEFEVQDVASHYRGDVLGKAWQDLLASGTSPEKIYQTRTYFEYVSDTESNSDNHNLTVVYDKKKNIVGILPVRKFRQELCFKIGRFCLVKYKFDAVQILGSVPLFSSDEPALPDTAFKYLLRRYPECRALVMQTVPQKSVDRYRNIDGLTEHVLHGWRDCHVFSLPGSVKTYLNNFSAKKRYNLRRQIRLLAENVGGIQLSRITEPHQIADFMKALRSIPAAQRHLGAIPDAHFHGLARHGLLLCYLLRSKDQVLAAMLGCKGHGTWHVSNIFYDKKYAQFSPGTSVVYLAQQDAIQHLSLQCVDFGYGNPSLESRSHHLLEKRGKLLVCQKLSMFNLILNAWTLFETSNQMLCMCVKRIKKALSR